MAEVGHTVTCVDIDENKVKLLESGKSPIFQDGLEELMQKNYAAGRLRYTTDYERAYRDTEVIFIGVGDSTFDLMDSSNRVYNTKVEPWKVTLVNTGLYTLTAGRLGAIKIDNETGIFENFKEKQEEIN